MTPAVSNWSGAVSDLWSNNGNWDVAPATNNDLAFPSTGSHLVNVNDLSGVNQFGSLTIGASGYSLSGNAISLSGSIDASQASGGSTIALPIALGGSTQSVTVTVDNSGSTLTASGVISGSGGLTKQGAGELILSGPNTYTGATTVANGSLQVNGAQAASAVTLQSGTTLSGIGTVGSIVSNSATITPGVSGPGVLTDNGALTLGTGSKLTIPLNGVNAGTDYGQLKVGGQVSLNDATLNATLGFTPTAHESFVLVNNTGSLPVNGQFHGLAEGSDLTISGQEFQISYKGGDGNDVVLTHLLSSSTAVTSSPASPVFGQAVTLTATVTGSNSQTPAGSVEFFNGTTSLGISTLVNGVATLQISSLSVGSNSITANYKGDTNFSPSTSPVSTVTVGQAATTSTLTASPNPSPFGQPVKLTATIAPTSPGAGTPTGTVEFFSGSTSLGTATLSNGTATLNSTDIPVGTNTLTAKYEGDTNFQTSTSQGVGQTITATAATSTTLSTSASSSVYGQSVTLTAHVAPNASSSQTLTGSVQFFSGTVSLGTATLTNGTATLPLTTLPVGADSITAKYLGDSNFAPSTSSASTVTVSQASTTTALTATPNPAPAGQPVTLKATITPVSPGAGSPSGTVEFFSGATSLGTATVTNGVATLTSTTIPTGTDNLTAKYAGDTNFQASTSPAVSQTITPTASTTTTLTTSESSIVFGQQITLTAKVAPSASNSNSPTGSVEFFSGTTSLGTATVTNGTATLSTTSLPLGTDSITAHYQGDSNFGPSTSSASSVTVAQAATSGVLTASPNPSAQGGAVTLSVAFKAQSPGSGTPTGTVEFYNGSTLLGTSTLNSSGVATFSTLVLPLGTSSLTAKYLGDTNFAGSTSPAYTQTVLTGTTSALTTSSSAIVYGQTITYTAKVTSSGSSSVTPTGTVNFYSGTVLLGQGTLSNGVATLTTTATPTGTDAITAVYQGDSNFATSTSPASTVAVSQASSLIKITASPTNVALGQGVTLTATVTAVSPGSGTPTGTVTFKNGTTPLGTATLTNGVATLTTTSLPLGSASITASYGGDSNFTTSSASPVSVTVAQGLSGTVLSTFQDTSFTGQGVILTATVRSLANPTNPTIPTGSIKFYNGSTLIGTVALGGTATASLQITNLLTAGTNSFAAIYSGDNNYLTSTSAPLIQTVIPGPTTTSVGTSSTPAANQPVTLTAFVGPLYPSNGQPTGTVKFLVNGQVVGTSNVSNGQATLTVGSLPVGNATVLAVYTGDSNYQGSTSISSTITVGNTTQLYVNKVYLQYLNHSPSETALNFWTNRLERGFPANKFVQTIRRQALAQRSRLHRG